MKSPQSSIWTKSRRYAPCSTVAKWWCRFGAGVDSPAMLAALRAAGIRPALITFDNTNTEKPESLARLARMNDVLAAWGWPLIQVCRKVPMTSIGYSDLYGNCLANRLLDAAVWIALRNQFRKCVYFHFKPFRG